MAIYRTQPQRRSPWRLWIIPVLLIGLIGWLAWSKQDAIMEKLGFQPIETANDQTLLVGDEVTLEGALSSSNNLRYYTMLLTTADQGVVGVKSTVLDLSSYRGDEVIVRGTVVDVINNVPVVNALSLVANGENISDETVVTDVQYVSAAAVLLDPAAMDGYSVSRVDADTIVFQSADGEEVEVAYFACTDDESASTGCRYVIDQLASAESRFTGTDGDEWVQLPETNTRFGTNDDRIGYRVTDVDKSLITDMMSNVTFVNDRYVSRYLTTPAKEACQTIDHTMSYVSSTDVDYRDASVRLTLEGTDTEGESISCVVDADPRTRAVTLVSIDADDTVVTDDDTTDDDTATDEDTTTTDTTASATPGVNTDPSPLLGTELPFTSTKGYSIIFPSSNIAFQGVNNTKSIGIDGVAGCRSQMNVVAFSNATNVVSSPAIIMYDCRDVDETTGPLNGYIRKDSPDSDKTFFIKVINDGRTEFANNIEIKG